MNSHPTLICLDVCFRQRSRKASVNGSLFVFTNEEICLFRRKVTRAINSIQIDAACCSETENNFGEVKTRERLVREHKVFFKLCIQRLLFLRKMSDWSSGLCACFENVGICIKAFICPCIVAGQIGEALGEGCCYHGFCSLMGPVGIYCGAQNRGKLREKYQIPVSWSFQVNEILKCPGEKGRHAIYFRITKRSIPRPSH